MKQQPKIGLKNYHGWTEQANDRVNTNWYVRCLSSFARQTTINNPIRSYFPFLLSSLFRFVLLFIVVFFKKPTLRLLDDVASVGTVACDVRPAFLCCEKSSFTHRRQSEEYGTR